MQKKNHSKTRIIFRIFSLLVLSVWIISLYVILGDYIVKHKLLIFVSTTTLMAMLILIGFLNPKIVSKRIKKGFQ